MKNIVSRFLFGTAIVACLVSGAYGGELTLESSASLPLRPNSDAPTSQMALKFNLSDIPENAIIDMAVIKFKVNLDTTVAGPQNLMAYPITDSWTASDVPSDYTDISFADSLSYLIPLNGRTGASADILVTKLVQRWHSGAYSNHGMLIRGFEKPDSRLDVHTDSPGVKAVLKIYYSGGQVRD